MAITSWPTCRRRLSASASAAARRPACAPPEVGTLVGAHELCAAHRGAGQRNAQPFRLRRATCALVRT